MLSTSLFKLGQRLKGRLGDYTITKEIQAGVYSARAAAGDIVVIKAVEGHPRVQNECEVLKRFQRRTHHLRPLIDEIEEPAQPPTIVLKYLDDHLLNASIKATLNRLELKYVSKSILEALKVLHDDGYVHADVKPDNVFVNYNELSQDGCRFSEVQLGDMGSSYPASSNIAKDGTPIGAPIWTSPEVIMETPWNMATDIWSFGTLLISLIYGGDFNLFRPKNVSYGDEEYGLEVLKRQFQYFAPFPPKYAEIASTETISAIQYLMDIIPKSATTPFHLTANEEVCKKDRIFIGKIMKMDWRDRPTASELLQDEWFKDKEEEEPRRV